MHPDVVLVDVNLGNESGFDVVRRLQQGNTFAPVTILISTRAPQDYADLIAASPAVGSMGKSELSVTAIQTLLNGED